MCINCLISSRDSLVPSPRFTYLGQVSTNIFQVGNPTHATAHAPEKIFQHKLQIFQLL